MGGENNNYLESLFAVTGKTALVTGGATGIGRMIATGLACAGARVLIASRKGEDCEKTASQINEAGVAGSVEGFSGDVGSEEGVLTLATAVRERTDRLDILVNNAGVSWGADYEEFPHSAWAKVMNINVAGLFSLTRDLTPLLIASGSIDDPARIINLGSVMGTVPLADKAYSYSASKAAVHHLTRILAEELATRHVTVNAFAPGPFQSKMTAFATAREDQVERVSAGVPLGRIGRPDDVAGATLFLCGRAGAYITGAILPIDGGMSVQHAVSLFKDAH